MTLSQRDRRALVWGGIGLGGLLLYLFVIEPALAACDELVSEHQVLAARLARVPYENQEAAYYEKALAEWESRAEAIGPPKPFDVQATAIGEKIVTAAQQNQVNLKNTTWSAARAWPDDPALAMVTLHLQAEAEWEPVFKFIAAAYAIDGVLSVEDLELTGDPKQGGKLSMSLRFSVLVKAAAQDAGSLFYSSGR